MKRVKKPRSGWLSVLAFLAGSLHINAGFHERKDTRHRCKTEFFILLLLLLAVVMPGCGSAYSSSAGVNLPVAVALTITPPVSMQTGATNKVAATVSNDPANKGVTWGCAPSASCGSFKLAQTASGATTSYSAPANMPAGGGVTITATSVSDTTKNATANVTITAPPISIAITTAPPPSMQTNATASAAATVSNDSANKGVTWSCTPSASCGSFSPAQTASGAATTYTAPANVPGGRNATITATAVSDVTQTASATVAITVIGSNASLNGQYAFLITGRDINGSYAVAGSLTFNGNGNITAGEQDLTNTVGLDLADPVTGTYAVAPDGRGTITLNLQVLATTETFAFTITSASHALLNQDDGTDTGSGVLDLQTAGPAFAPSQFSGGYSFTLTGEDSNAFQPAVVGGVFNADGVSTLQSGTLDENLSGALITGTPFTGTFAAPDANGRGTIAFSTGATFAYYLVRLEVVRLIETDTLFVFGGTAYGQGATSSFTNSSLAGSFVFNNVGSSLSGSFSAFASFAAAGQFATDGNGNFTGGTADANNNGSVTSGSLAASTYAFNNSPRGAITIPAGVLFPNGMALFVYLVDPNLNLLDPSNASGGGGALILTNDASIFGVGMIVPQVTPAPSKLAGNYAANFTSAPNAGAEVDLTGQVVADLSGNLNGTADYANDAGSSTSFSTTNVTYTGTFAPDGNNPGRLTGTLLLTGGTLQFVPGGVTQNLSYYQADGSRMFAVETDTNVATGILIHQ